jgi:hypothetical protein
MRNHHYVDAMRKRLEAEREVINSTLALIRSQKRTSKAVAQQQWLTEQLRGNQKAFARLRTREQKEKSGQR